MTSHCTRGIGRSGNSRRAATKYVLRLWLHAYIVLNADFYGRFQVDAQKPKKQRVNTAVFVTSIPLDVKFDEIRDTFSKCGVIAEEIDSGNPRIKMYNDDDGSSRARR